MQNIDSTPIWFELNTADEAKAQHFYAATTGWMTGWTIAPSPMVEHGDYLIAGAPDDAAIAGIAPPSERASALRLPASGCDGSIIA